MGLVLEIILPNFVGVGAVPRKVGTVLGTVLGMICGYWGRGVGDDLWGTGDGSWG